MTMQDWPEELILAIGLGLYVYATVLSVVEEWPKQGLTDTSYHALFMWMVGGIAMAVGAYLAELYLVMDVGMASCVATSLGLGLKLRDTKRYRRHR